MESLSHTGAESPPPPPPPDPEPTRQEKIDYLTKTLPKLRKKTDGLLQRYQEAGIKWHLIPYAARASHHNDQWWINVLDEVFGVAVQDGGLAECVSEPFGKLLSCVIECQKALDRGDKHLSAARVFMESALYYARKLEEKISVTEAVVADLIAVRNAIDEQGLLVNPEVMLTMKLEAFEDWMAALCDAEQGWIEMKSRLLADHRMA